MIPKFLAWAIGRMLAEVGTTCERMCWGVEGGFWGSGEVSISHVKSGCCWPNKGR